MAEKEQKKGKIIVKIVIVLVLLLILLGLAFGKKYFKINEITITGNEYYTEEEIREKVFSGHGTGNSLYLYLKYKYGKAEDIPFIQKIDVDMISNHEVQINVYEKSIVACIQYMGEYLYFDKDGIIMESSSKQKKGIPVISGVKFTSMNLNQKLEVEDDTIFKTILDISQLINRYKLKMQKIVFNQEREVTLVTDDIKVQLGKKDEYDAQIAELSKLLPKAIKKKLKGTLNMENYEEGQGQIIFTEERKNTKKQK